MLWYTPVLASVLRLVFPISGQFSYIYVTSAVQDCIDNLISYFRGPKGVWTLEEKGEKPTINVSFNDAVPTKTHMSLVKLVKEGNYEKHP